MSIELVRDCDFGSKSWNDKDENPASKASSDIAGLFQKVVLYAKARCFSLSSVLLVSATQTNEQNQESKKRTGKWSASVGAEQDMKGNTKADATFSIEKRVSNDLSWSVDMGATMKKEKEQDVEFGTKGVVKLGGEF